MESAPRISTIIEFCIIVRSVGCRFVGEQKELWSESNHNSFCCRCRTLITARCDFCADKRITQLSQSLVEITTRQGRIRIWIRTVKVFMVNVSLHRIGIHISRAKAIAVRVCVNTPSSTRRNVENVLICGRLVTVQHRVDSHILAVQRCTVRNGNILFRVHAKKCLFQRIRNAKTCASSIRRKQQRIVLSTLYRGLRVGEIRSTLIPHILIAQATLETSQRGCGAVCAIGCSLCRVCRTLCRRCRSCCIRNSCANIAVCAGAGVVCTNLTTNIGGWNARDFLVNFVFGVNTNL